MHVCSKCKQEKETNQMSLDASRRGGISSWCKECRKVSARKWATSNPDKVEAQNIRSRTAYREKPPEYKDVRSYMLKYRYGIDQQAYDALLESQSYACAICKRSTNDMTYHLHTDHCHSTGKVRGLLCSPCNTYLGYIKDNPAVYEAGVKYIKDSYES